MPHGINNKFYKIYHKENPLSTTHPAKTSLSVHCQWENNSSKNSISASKETFSTWRIVRDNKVPKRMLTFKMTSIKLTLFWCSNSLKQNSLEDDFLTWISTILKPPASFPLYTIAKPKFLEPFLLYSHST